MIITLKDGKQLEVEGAMSALDITKRISEGLARTALVAKADGKFVSMNETVDRYCTFEVFTFKDEEGRLAYRHTCSHILAQAVRNIYPTAQLAIGPAVKDGFYYDFEFKTPITQADFEKIEAEMKSIIKADMPIVDSTMNRKDAEKFIKKSK